MPSRRKSDSTQTKSMQMWLPRLASNLSERLSSPAARSPPRFVGTYATSRSRGKSCLSRFSKIFVMNSFSCLRLRSSPMISQSSAPLAHASMTIPSEEEEPMRAR